MSLSFVLKSACSQASPPFGNACHCISVSTYNCFLAYSLDVFGDFVVSTVLNFNVWILVKTCTFLTFGDVMPFGFYIVAIHHLLDIFKPPIWLGALSQSLSLIMWVLTQDTGSNSLVTRIFFLLLEVYNLWTVSILC